MKKKIVIVISELYLGGTEKHLLNVLKRLSQYKNLDFLVLTLTAKGDFYHQFTKLKNIKLHNIQNKKRYYTNKFLKFFYVLFIMLQTYFFLRKYSPTIIHFFLPTSYIIAGFPSILIKNTKLLMSRRSLNLYQKKYFFVRFFEKLLHSKMNLILSNCNEVSKQLAEEGILKDKIHIINNGIDINKLNYNKIIDQNTKIIFLFLANFIPYKGHDLLVEAVNKLDKKYLKKIHFWLFGKNNDYTIQIINKINRYHLNEYFTIKDQIIDVNYYLQKSHVGISVSQEEGMSNSILEYMNYNMPVIGTKVGGTIELIQDHYNGILINKNSQKELIKAIAYYIDNYNLISVHGSNSKQIVSQKYSIEQCVESYKDLYDTL